MAPSGDASQYRLLVAVMIALTGCTVITGPARHSVAPPPDRLGAETVSFASNSGTPIRAWFARGQAGSGAVLLLHGVGDDRTSMRARAIFLHDRGFTILAPDFQAHGESPGDHITYGARESLDAAAALAFLRASAPGERVGVIGVSMGGAASLLGNGPLTADAFVLESVYPTFRQAVSNRLGAWLGPIGGIGRWFTSSVIGLIGAESGVTEEELRPIAQIERLHAPLLLLSGTIDRYTPLAEAESLFAHAPAPKSFWPVEGADHVDLYAFATAEYQRRVGGFLVEQLHASAIDSSRRMR